MTVEPYNNNCRLKRTNIVINAKRVIINNVVNLRYKGENSEAVLRKYGYVKLSVEAMDVNDKSRLVGSHYNGENINLALTFTRACVELRIKVSNDNHKSHRLLICVTKEESRISRRAWEATGEALIPW